MVDKYEFASPEWAEYASEWVENALADADLEGVDVEFCEEFTDPPAHLAGETGTTGWHMVIKDGEVNVGYGVIDAKTKIVADYQTILPYTKEDGCLAYVPGSHLEKQPSTSAEAAVPVEAPRGSLIVFHGATVHGAYPKQTPGLRLTLVNYFRHQAILPQEEIKNGFPCELAEDCVDPDLFCELAGYADVFPFVTQTSTSPTPHPHLAADG